MKKRHIILGLLLTVRMISNAQNVESSASRTIGGLEAGFSGAPSHSTFYGYRAGYTASSASGTSRGNSFIGHESGKLVTTGGSNTFLGASTGIATTTGDRNLFLGANAGQNNITGSDNIFIGYCLTTTAASSTLSIGHTTTTGVPLIWGNFTNNEVKMNGKVGVGSVSAFPTMVGTADVSAYKLFVTGGLLADEVRVSLSSGGTWADYVFAKDYKLPTLDEVERHILEKGYLPDMPSAKEVAENGIALGEMSKIQQEKIEELTLYAIEQHKTISKQGREIEELKTMVNALLAKK